MSPIIPDGDGPKAGRRGSVFSVVDSAALIMWFGVGIATLTLRAAPASAPANYDEARVEALPLPDPLVCNDGTPVRDVATWQIRRRPELLELFSREVYGRTPHGRPPGLHWTTTAVDRAALGGKAVRREVTVWFTDKQDGPQMHLLIYQPPGEPGAHDPWPVFLGLNFFGNICVNADPAITMTDAWMRVSKGRAEHVVDHRATEATRGCQASRWQVEKVVARGYATITAYYGDFCPDDGDGLTKGVGAMFNTGSVNDRAPDAWGAIGVWAWGLSRALDWIEGDLELDGGRVAVHGHSRLGKAALWAAAQDERFALAISNDSGAAGAALSKRIYGETVAISTSGPITPVWYCRNYARYADEEAALPVDQHELLAVIAPRPLYVASAEEDKWSDPRGEFLAAREAGRVYALFGRHGVGVGQPPSANHPVGETIRYHVRSGPHDITVYDWAQYLDFADQWMKRRK